MSDEPVADAETNQAPVQTEEPGTLAVETAPQTAAQTAPPDAAPTPEPLITSNGGNEVISPAPNEAITSAPEAQAGTPPVSEQTELGDGAVSEIPSTEPAIEPSPEQNSQSPQTISTVTNAGAPTPVQGSDMAPPETTQIQSEAKLASAPVSSEAKPAIISTPADFVRDLLAKANAKIQERKRKKLDKILAEISKKEKITNREVSKLLRVSNVTAFRYLDILEKEGTIKQTGAGRSVSYSKN